MTLEDNFNHHTKDYFFSNNISLFDQRKEIFNKIKLDKFEKKNNESLKYLKFSDLSSFDYFYNPVKEEPSVDLIEKNNYNINLLNGVCKNYQDNNIEIRNVTTSDFEKFLEQKNNYQDDIVVDFNKIFLNCGIFIDIKQNKKIILNLKYHTSKNYTIFQNNFFTFQKNCKVEINENYNLKDNTISNIKHNIKLNDKSEVEHNIFQNFSISNKLYLTSNTTCEKNSSYSQNTFNFSNDFVRNFHFTKLNGEFSKASLKGCFFLKDDNVCSNKTYIMHKAPNCISDQTYKGILKGNSKANYFSNTFVSENAQKTEGYQLSKGILLDDNCFFFSKPELRIYADDVKCSHGSTIGPVDESALYYLRSRGINKSDAMKMIISAFIKEDIHSLNDKNFNFINENLSKFLETINND